MIKAVEEYLKISEYKPGKDINEYYRECIIAQINLKLALKNIKKL